MLTSKQRAFLRSLANGEDTIVHIGKGGITENTVKQTAEALKARELVKCRVLEASLLDAKAACDELAEKTGADGVQVIGTRFVLYKANPDSPAIKLPKK
ncbi:MAG: YhbY family RNA-binding protein [Oscillospiraceae bacterium]|jgi:RNA-binding protein|nr:YhbY family RNA-binding protein [Oscillospiraceae bacterium]